MYVGDLGFIAVNAENLELNESALVAAIAESAPSAIATGSGHQVQWQEI